MHRSLQQLALPYTLTGVCPTLPCHLRVAGHCRQKVPGFRPDRVAAAPPVHPCGVYLRWLNRPPSPSALLTRVSISIGWTAGVQFGRHPTPGAPRAASAFNEDQMDVFNFAVPLNCAYTGRLGSTQCPSFLSSALARISSQEEHQISAQHGTNERRMLAPRGVAGGAPVVGASER